MTYPLGWSVVTQTLIRRERWPGRYKTRGIALVYPGQEVQADQPVIRLEKTEQVPEEAGNPANVASAGGQSSGGLSNLSLASANAVSVGAPTASAVREKVGTQVSAVSENVPAGLRGRVVDITRRGGVIIESRAAVIQGAIGAGNQVAGVLTLWKAPGSSRGQQPIPPGAILIVPGPLNFAMLRQALISGVAGVVASSISSHDLEGFLRTDLAQLIDSPDIELAQANLPSVTLLLTEGLGTIAMPVRTINLLSQYAGSIALISGATSIRQAIYPDLIISLPLAETQQNWHPVQPDPNLAIGAQVRVCSGDHEGAIGEITYLFTHQHVFPSGVRSRGGDSVTVAVGRSSFHRLDCRLVGGTDLPTMTASAAVAERLRPCRTCEPYREESTRPRDGDRASRPSQLPPR